ncbi:MAG: exo-alpha-sialidase, partial [Anaerocolumna sp.]|nr:exo-alpha-sialidase [Anaerocolumna sp.]
MKQKMIIIVMLIIAFYEFSNPITVYASNTSKPSKSQKMLFEGEKGGYAVYRIPGMVTTKRGTMITYVEARSSESDWAPMDIIMVRSTDSGKTWSKPNVLVNGLDMGKTVNNPVMIASKDGTIHLLYCVEYGVESKGGGVFYRKSTNDGLNWSEPIDISASTNPEYRNAIATGPGHGIELSNGTLIIPIWLVPKRHEADPSSHQPSEVSTLYSRDKGLTWNVGEIIPADQELTSPNESTVVELSDGSIMINMRNTSTKKQRAVSVSTNGYSNWSKPIFDKTLTDPGCFGSLIRYDENTILFVNAQSNTIRKNITIKVSYDDGKTWSIKRLVHSGKGAYSELSVDKNGMIHVLVETAPSKSIIHYSFPLSWVEYNASKLKSLDISV